MDYIKDIEPIHEMPVDELQAALDTAREHLEELSDPTNPTNLTDLADSIKKSLVIIFPEFDELIHEIVDANEACYAQSWAGGFSQLKEGVKALRRIYGVLHDYQTPDDFQEMEQSIKDYASIAKEYFFEKKRQEDEPLIEDGKIRRRQLGAPKDKMNKTLLEAVRSMMDRRLFPSAMHLMTSFPVKEKSLFINGREIYKEESEDGDLKIIIKEPDGKLRQYVERTFANYYKKVKKTLHVNS